MMKNAFYFMLKAFFSLEMFTCLSSLFGYVEKRLNKKAKDNFKIYTSQPGQQIIAMHILHSISRSKGNRQSGN